MLVRAGSALQAVAACLHTGQDQQVCAVRADYFFFLSVSGVVTRLDPEVCIMVVKKT